MRVEDALDEQLRTPLTVVVDRLKLPAKRKRLVEALEQGMFLGNHHVDVRVEGHQHFQFSSELYCPHSRQTYVEPGPNHFSFNSPVGACESCKGFGRVIQIDPNLVVPDMRRSIRDGAIRPLEYREGPVGAR